MKYLRVAEKRLLTARRYYGTCVHYTDLELDFKARNEQLEWFLGGGMIFSVTTEPRL